MRFAIALGLLVGSLSPSLLPLSNAPSTDQVRILVPKTDPRTLGTGPDRVMWRRVEVSVERGKPDAFDLALAKAGPGAILERRYRLDSPDLEPLFHDQWGLENTGQSGGSPDADIDATSAWTESTGSGVVVAVIDSGVDSSHPDLAGQTTGGGWDTVDNDADPSPNGLGADNAHGTMVAGIVAAAANGVGITGVAPASRILAVRACSNGDCWSLDLAEAIYFAVDAGADIINLSLGAPGIADPPVEDAISYAKSNGVLVVAAMGNDGQNTDSLPSGEIMIPGGLPFDNIIGVAASDPDDGRAGFSNYGPQSVDVFAPGEAILTTGALELSDYLFVSGTSFAASFVTGTAALLLSDDPSITYHELMARVEGFTDHPIGLSGLSRYGRINAGTTLTKRFVDTSNSVFVNAIDWLAGEEITEGCNPPQNHKYCPNQSVTRGEMAVFYARAFGLPLTNEDFFTDDEGRFYEAAANRLAAAGITVGCALGKYCGDRDITREEMAAMISRALNLPQTSTDYFIDDGNSIFEGAINKIAEARITIGCNPPINDRFCPTDDVTRGQMSAFLKRSVEKLNS